jgi:hypothetical protein
MMHAPLASVGSHERREHMAFWIGAAWIAFAAFLAAYIRVTSVPPLATPPATPVPHQVVPQDDPADRATAFTER